MAKRGRPPVEDPRVLGLRIRLNEEEVSLLEKACKKSGLSKTDLFRSGFIKMVQECLGEKGE